MRPGCIERRRQLQWCEQRTEAVEAVDVFGGAEGVYIVLDDA